jgi:ubiquitin-like protein Pup
VPERVQVQPRRSEKSEPESEETAQGMGDLGETDDLLEEIDSVLEANELEVVQRFVQRGGE